MEEFEKGFDPAVACIVTEDGTKVIFGERSLEDIAAEIKQSQDSADDSYLRIGQLLLEAKKHFGRHGEWHAWLNENVDFSVYKVQRLIRVAEWADSNAAPVPHLEFTKAYILSRLSQEDLKNFLVGKQVEKMSKPELQKAVCDYLRHKADKAPTVATTTKHEVIASAEDKLRQRFERLKSDVLKIAGLIKGKPDYEALADELREFVVRQLPPENFEVA